MPVPDNYRRSDTQAESKHLRAADYDLDVKWRLVIEDVTLEELPGRDGKPPRRRLILHFADKKKGLVLNATNQGFIEARLGLKPNDWIGASIILHRTTTVFGEKTQEPAFRIIECKKVAAAPKAKPAPKVQPLVEDDIDAAQFDEGDDRTVPF